MNALDHDDIIDRVARDMTDGDPSPRFRQRVLHRLPPVRRGAWMRVAIPAGVMAMGVLGVLAGWPGRTPPSPPLDDRSPSALPARPSNTAAPPAFAAAAAASAAPAEAEAAAIPPPAVGAPTADAAEPGSLVAPAPAAADPAEPEGPGLLEPLSTPEPIAIEPIQPIAPTIAPITVDPIVVRSTPPVPDPGAGGSQRAPTAPTP